MALAEHLMAALCLNYLTFECFEETESRERSICFLKGGSYAFQDYAIAHWRDHALAAMQTTRDELGVLMGQHSDLSAPVRVFAYTFSADLQISPNHHVPLPESSWAQFSECVDEAIVIWKHVKALTGLSDDQGDKVSLPSLREVLMRIRKVHEDLGEELGPNSTDRMSLTELYGENWFKCNRLSCHYFHEGFRKAPMRQDHYDRHDRPFKCDEEDCIAAGIGLSSLKELEKHRRNMHPGLDRLSATFARLKRGGAGQASALKHPCPLCPMRFSSRVECRAHMVVHNRRLLPDSQPDVQQMTSRSAREL